MKMDLESIWMGARRRQEVGSGEPQESQNQEGDKEDEEKGKG